MTLIGRRVPLPLVGAGLVTAAVVALPAVFVLAEAGGVGWAQARTLLLRSTVAQLLGSTAALTAAVTALSIVIGVAAAWCTERTDLPAVRMWRVLVVLPVAIPEFVSGYSWVSLTSAVYGFGGAVLISTLSLYPLVYLPVAAMLRGRDPAQDQVARSLGLGPGAVFRRVTLPQIRPAMLGGALIVGLHLLGEYGAFAIVRYPTFATEIFTEYNLGFDPGAAALLSVVLIVLCVALLGGETRLTGAAQQARIGGGVARQTPPVRLGRLTAPVLTGFAGLVTLALGVPIGSLGYWLIRGGSTTLPPASIWAAAGFTLTLGAAAAAVTTLLALPVALLAVRHRARLTVLLERSTYLARALPGVVVALALVFFALHYVPIVYQSAPLLVLAYAVLFLPLALIALRATLTQIPPGLAEMGRSLGRPPMIVLVRVTLPLLGPGLAAAAALVFLSTTTELTATLLLRPTGLQTLATQFWVYTSGLAYGAAAPYAALMVAVSALPTYLLTRRIDSLSTTAT
ncbi:MAG: iron ABC transporter permease [Pseudonocardiales bacterium]|nr:iron ABC transporter permease [Actinomycetota bacterium]PZS24043.1 MAG: iron ABC transporter permease [Pseudonocardiales bacterium]